MQAFTIQQWVRNLFVPILHCDTLPFYLDLK